jgi:hypothetical protein
MELGVKSKKTIEDYKFKSRILYENVCLWTSGRKSWQRWVAGSTYLSSIEAGFRNRRFPLEIISRVDI